MADYKSVQMHETASLIVDGVREKSGGTKAAAATAIILGFSTLSEDEKQKLLMNGQFMAIGVQGKHTVEGTSVTLPDDNVASVFFK